jgi:hypothetical protein
MLLSEARSGSALTEEEDEGDGDMRRKRRGRRGMVRGNMTEGGLRQIGELVISVSDR